MARCGRGVIPVLLAATLGAGIAATTASGGVPCRVVSAPPGAVYLYSDQPTDLVVIGTNFQFDGNDGDIDGSTGPMSPVAGIATRNDVNTAEAIGSLGGSQLDNVLGLGFEWGPPTIPSILTIPHAPSVGRIGDFIDALLVLPGVVTYSDAAVSGNLTLGIYEVPVISRFTAAELTVTGTGTLSGVGVLVVDGDLSVVGTLDYIGLVIVRGRMRIGQIDEGGTIISGNTTMYGSLWTHDLALSSGGSALVRYSSQALGLADAAGAGAACEPPGCGDAFVDPGEECDDGNTTGGDCCSPACTLDPPGTPCDEDADACTDDVCDGAGVCTHPPNTAPCDDGDACTTGETCAEGACGGGVPVTCDHCLACDPETGCPAPPVCRAPDRPGRARLVVSTTRRAGQRLRFKWRGGLLTPADFGDPMREHAYEVCISTDDTLATFHGSAGPGFPCTAGGACWRLSRRGFLWRRGDGDTGLRRVALRAGTVRSASIAVAADGSADVLAPLPWPTPLTVQVRGAHGICWEAKFAADDVAQTDGRLVGRGSLPSPDRFAHYLNDSFVAEGAPTYRTRRTRTSRLRR